MSVISSRKSLNSSILKSAASRTDSIKKTKILRFDVEILSVKEILKDIELDDNPNVKSYQNLIYKLSEPELKDTELRKIMSEAIESVPLIKKDHILLVQSLLNIKWVRRDAEIIELYHKFIISLMTSKTDFLVLCLSKIVGCFIPDSDEGELWINGSPSPELQPKLQLVHDMVKKALDIMPMIPVSLRKQIRFEFPYYKQANFRIVAYIHNLLQMLEYCPNMIYDVLELLLENLLRIDVNVTREQIEQSEEVEDEDDEVMKLPVAETLDMCMEKLFEYLRVKLADDSTADKSDQQVMLQVIFHYFDEHILKTYTKHIHFVMFYIASVRRSFLTDFLAYLWTKITDRNQSTTVRQTAIGYLSSFLARAKFLPQDLLQNYLELLSAFAQDYIRICDFTKNKNPKAHVVFYAICQAIFYVVAFRSRDLTRSDQNLQFLLQLDLWPIVKHPLNPLNVCLPAIATIFDNVTAKYQILFCHTIIVANASKRLTTVYANDQHRPEEVVESVFPFDPYMLKKSGRRIQPLYIEYQGSEDDFEVNSPRGSQKRTRNESVSCDLEDFIIRDTKIQKIV